MAGLVFQRPSVWKWGQYPSLGKPTRTHYTLSYNYRARRDPIHHPVLQFSLLFSKSATCLFKINLSPEMRCVAELTAECLWLQRACQILNLAHSASVLPFDSPGTLGLWGKQYGTTTDLLQPFHFTDLETEAQTENTAVAKAEHLWRHSQIQNPGLLSPGPWMLLALHCVGHPDFVFLFDTLGPRTDLTHRLLAAFTARNTTVWQDISYIKQI